ncbi:ER membrane protein complex subunit 10-like [Glandiceps talaboti]
MAAYVFKCAAVALLFFSIFVSATKRGDSNIDFDTISSLNLPIEHAVGIGPDVEFSVRGSLQFRSLKSTVGTFRQSPLLSGDFRDTLRDAASNKKTLYRVRVPTKLTGTTDEENEQYVSSFIKACSLYESRLSDFLMVTIDPSGHVLSISIAPLNGECHGNEIDEFDLDNFNTTVELASISSGPTPETQAYVQKLEEEKAQKEKGGSTEQKSFFGKYWMYIIPVVLFLLLSSAQDPNAQRGGGGGN